MIDAEFVRAIADLATSDDYEHELFEVQGQTYRIEPDGTAKPYGDRVVEAAVLSLSTLDSLVTYLGENRDGLDLDELAIHVVNPQTVNLVGKVLEANGKRPNLAVVHFPSLFGQGTEFAFGRYLAPETFIIGLQTLFADTGQRADVLKFSASVRGSKDVEATDDGVAQTATLRSGVSLNQIGKIPNPVHLAPFRTFREIEQPTTAYILRAQQGSNPEQPPQLGLFEADGGKWRLSALMRIKEYLGDKLAMEAQAGGEKPEDGLASIPVYA